MNETCSEGCEDDIVTLLEVGLVVPKCQWYRGGRGIAIVVNVDNHLVERQVGSLCHRVYDAEVGLVWDNPIEVGVVQPIALHHLCHVVAHVSHRMAEHRAAFLIDVVQTIVNGEMGRRAYRASSFHVKERQALAIGKEHGVLETHAFLLSGLNEHGTRAVAEKDTRLAVCPVNDRRHLLRGANYHLLVASRLYHRRRGVEGVNESAASARHVERESVFQSELADDDACR